MYAIAKEGDSKRWQITKGRMLDNVIVSHFASESNGWFGKPFDGVYPELVLSEVEGQGRRAQDRLTTKCSGPPICARSAAACKCKGVTT